MSLLKRNKQAAETPVSEMKLSDREKTIGELEKDRCDVIRDIERMMKLLSKETGRRSLKKRKHKLGKAPNDYGYIAKKRRPI